MDFTVGSRHIGHPDPCFVIAEVGLAHDGSLSQAHAFVDAAAKAGAEAVKFQCHLGDAVSEWRVRPEWQQDETRQDYWRRTGFSEAQWQELARHCAMAGVEFLCSVFSLEAVKLVNPLVRLHKIPSGRIADVLLLSAVASTSKPVLLSTGMASYSEIIEALKFMQDAGCKVGVMQCTTVYPAPPELTGLWFVAEWDGLSDHSGTIYAGIAAVALGCKVLEVHVCWSKDQGGFDTAASITVQQLGELVRGVRFVEQALRPLDKDVMAEQLSGTRQVFMGVGT